MISHPIPKVLLRDLSFEAIDAVLRLHPGYDMQRFVEPVARTIALSLVGNNLGYPGFFQLICCDEVPVGIVLIGRAPVEAHEPAILQSFKYVYRLMGFFVDHRHQHKGIGRAALRLALEKLEAYPDGDRLPVYLECHQDNTAALSLYFSIGFNDIGALLDDGDRILVRLPTPRHPDCPKKGR